MTNQTNTQLARELAAAHRQLEIEAALERVRSRSLAMERTDELKEVAKVLFDAFNGLGLDPVYLSLMSEDADGTSRVFAATSEFEDQMESKAYWTAHPIIASVKAAREAGQRHFHRALERTEIVEMMEGFHRTVRGVRTLTRRVLDNPPECVDAYVLFYSSGHLVFWAQTALSDEDLEIAHRFAQAFGFAHNRHLDLAEKIRQNRELTIQNALEQVRAQALSMQVSEDLFSVTTVLHEQMAAVGIQSVVTSIEVVDRENGLFRNAAMLQSGEGTGWHAITDESDR